jgi:hypothetical protein
MPQVDMRAYLAKDIQTATENMTSTDATVRNLTSWTKSKME